jgi:hypothetical protein
LFSPVFREGSGSELIRYGSHFPKEPFDMPVERFLASLRFENKAKLDDLGLEIDINAPKLNY